MALKTLSSSLRVTAALQETPETPEQCRLHVREFVNETAAELVDEHYLSSLIYLFSL